MTTKVIAAISGLLGRTPLGREVLAAGRAEEERLDERRAATKELTEAAEAEENLGALADSVEAAEAAYEAEIERLGTKLAAARRDYSASLDSIGRLRSRAFITLRNTAPEVVSDRGRALSALQAAREHVGAHISTTSDEQLREQIRDFERAGKPAADKAGVDRVRRLLEVADWSRTCAETVTEAQEQIHESALEVEPDAEALFAELLDHVLVSRCICGHEFHFAEAFDSTPTLAIA